MSVNFLDYSGLQYLWGKITTLVNGRYALPNGGIPLTDISSAAQGSIANQAPSGLTAAGKLSHRTAIGAVGMPATYTYDSSTVRITELANNADYVCTTALTSLTIDAVSSTDAGLVSTVRFTAQSNTMTFNVPSGWKFIGGGYPQFEANTEYLLMQCNGIVSVVMIGAVSE